MTPSAMQTKHTISQEYPPAALQLVDAIKKVHRLDSIGYCPSKVDQMEKHMMSYGCNKKEDDSDEDDSQEDAALKEAEQKREEKNSEIVAQVGRIFKQHGRNSASGYLDQPFELRVTLPGCEFNDVVTSPKLRGRYPSAPDYTNEERKAIGSRLEAWYDAAAVSGFGDVREQVTKVDKKVRHAREILASEFSVAPELLERIAALWDERFYPNSGVRVEPYKIHLYGPGGHFKTHRDTPQKDLVGTFLLGLGDTSFGGGLVVDGKEMPAHQGHWCAFYPDVPHRVGKLWGGHRAVIAFKIFRAQNETGEETATSIRVREDASQLIKQMEAPFGIMLSRQYCLGTTEFSGFDAMLLEATLTRPDVEVRHLPVALQSRSKWGHEEESYDEPGHMSCQTRVFPFTRKHIEMLSGSSSFGELESDSESESEGSEQDSDSKDSEPDSNSKGSESGSMQASSESSLLKWVKKLKNAKIPFFSFDLDDSLFTYMSEEDETCNYVGNEAQAWRDDSVYLSYALVVLPKAVEPTA